MKKFLINSSVISPQRIDQFLTSVLPKYSRSFITKLIKKGYVYLNGKLVKKKKKVSNGDKILVFLKKKSEIFLNVENIFLNVIYEDNYILLINKPSNMVVHPGYGNNSGTLLNSLLFHYKDSINIPRAGIVHRLDKETTGIMIVAKNVFSYNILVESLKNRTIVREYDVIVNGQIKYNGVINAPISRNIRDRRKMMVSSSGKIAITHYKVVRIFKHHTHLRVKLETGRMHQIRVHFLYISHSVFGDSVYNQKKKNINFYKYPIFLKKKIINFSRQALHASKISFKHPYSSLKIIRTASPPKDLKDLVDALYLYGY